MRYIHFLELTPREVILEVVDFVRQTLGIEIKAKQDSPLDEDYFGVQFQSPLNANEIQFLCNQFPNPCENHFTANLSDDDPDAPVSDISEGLVFDILRKRYCNGNPACRVILFQGKVLVEIMGGDHNVS